MNTANSPVYLNINRRGGHYYVTLRAIYNTSDKAYAEKVDFIFDTGAFITVISRDIAELFGYDRLPKIPSKIRGYTGEAPADFVRIPGLKILNTELVDVPVLIPHNNELKQNILGLNVLEYFEYSIETKNDKMHIGLNANPRHYHKILECAQVIVDY
ncbi:MAG: retroviral-like aspartic protease family protein [Oscillospiraceae bacterium]|jgi:clan AA aspartic protease (TIGR02281 family)|nr:retroviral-like aspartic protease family protein [Oscillospiraceae bacterium]